LLRALPENGKKLIDMSKIETVNLPKGQVAIHRLGEVTLHVYLTNDPINDTVFVFERGGQAVVLEQPNFTDGIKELEAYLRDRKLTVAGVIPAYHMPGTFLPNIRRYSTRNAYEFATKGAGAQMVAGFVEAFGNLFDSNVLPITDFIEGDGIAIAGITFRVIRTADAFDVEIPEANLMYTHMLGHDSHSIVPGIDLAEALIGQLGGFVAKGYTLILSSHHAPESLEDVEIKIGYLEKLVDCAKQAKTSDEFKDSMRRAFPDLANENYLDMTAAGLFS
jgi:hypothetical protein